MVGLAGGGINQPPPTYVNETSLVGMFRMTLAMDISCISSEIRAVTIKLQYLLWSHWYVEN